MFKNDLPFSRNPPGWDIVEDASGIGNPLPPQKKNVCEKWNIPRKKCTIN
jgi:hypothetical protein